MPRKTAVRTKSIRNRIKALNQSRNAREKNSRRKELEAPEEPGVSSNPIPAKVRKVVSNTRTSAEVRKCDQDWMHDTENSPSTSGCELPTTSGRQAAAPHDEYKLLTQFDSQNDVTPAEPNPKYDKTCTNSQYFDFEQDDFMMERTITTTPTRVHHSVGEEATDSPILAVQPLTIDQQPHNRTTIDQAALSMELSGRRIVNFASIFQQIVNFPHVELFSCRNNSLQIVKEHRNGLQSSITIECSMCKAVSVVMTDHNDAQVLDINKCAVLGITSTGCGYSQMRELLSICNIPCMGPHLYSSSQDAIAGWVEEVTWESLKAAAIEERNIALTEGRIDSDGIAMITVIADGSWSKRSYRVNYNAPSGVAVIIGQRTQKVLFLGVRNKYCSICVSAQGREIEPKEHKCFKNWNGTSTSMEADIIVEGFLTSVEMYGLKYSALVGDGDSSVTKKLADIRPYGTTPVQKIECRNHLLRNMCTKLRELTTKRRSSKGSVVPVVQRKRIGDVVRRLRYGVQRATLYAIERNAIISAIIA